MILLDKFHLYLLILLSSRVLEEKLKQSVVYCMYEISIKEED